MFRVQGVRALEGLGGLGGLDTRIAHSRHGKGYLGLRVWGYTHALALQAHVGIWYVLGAHRGAHMFTAEPNDVERNIHMYK